MRFTGALAIAALLLSGTVADAMTSYRWKYRPVVVFAADETDAAFKAQRRIVEANRAGFAERDMVVVTVVGDRVTAELGPGPGESASSLRKRYGGSSGFKVVLVGKDGGAKLSSSEPLAASKLFSTIDAMPMRRDEMHRR